MKWCGGCERNRGEGDFYRHRGAPDGLQYRCKDCSKRHSKAWASSNPDRMAALQRGWGARNADKKAAYNRLYRASHPEKKFSGRRRDLERRAEWNEAYTRCGKRAENAKRWRAAHPDRAAAIDARKKLAKRNAVPRWYDANSVAKVYAKAREFGFEVDHIVPINSKIVCGLHVHANLQLLDRPLNASKSNRHWPDHPYL